MKKILAIMMTFAVLFGVFSVAFAAEDGIINSVESTEEIPEGYTAIRTAKDLNNIRNNLAGKYILMNDIDLSVHENWVPIGDAENPFTGELDGNGYSINNLHINISEASDTAYAALFAASENCVIMNISLNDVNIDISFETDKKFKWIYASSCVASATAETKIENCFADGAIKINSNCNLSVAGLASELNGKIKNCISNVKIDVVSTNESSLSYHYIGGVIAQLDGSIEKSASTATIKASYEGTSDIAMYVGGIAGYFSEGSSITNAYNSGNITTKLAESSRVGGVSGFTVGNISNVYCSGTIKCTGEEKNDGISPEIYFWSDDPLGLGLPAKELSKLENCYSTDSNIMGKYDEELATNISFLKDEDFKNENSFVGFDFENVWVMSEELGRPVFADENPKEETTTEPTTEVATTESTTETTTEKVEVSTTQEVKETTAFVTTSNTIETTIKSSQTNNTTNFVQNTTMVNSTEPTIGETTEIVSHSNSSNGMIESFFVFLIKGIYKTLTLLLKIVSVFIGC